MSMVEGLPPEMVDQVDQLFAGKLVAFIEVNLVGEDPIKLRLIRPLNCDHRLLGAVPISLRGAAATLSHRT